MLRAVVDFVGDGAREVLDLAEAMRIDFARRIGIADLLALHIPDGAPAQPYNLAH